MNQHYQRSLSRSLASGLPRLARCFVPFTLAARTTKAVPILQADRGPAAAARLVRALEVLDQRRYGEVPHQGATVAELCRLAGVSRNSVYRYNPDIVTALRLQQRGSAPDNGARHSHAGPAPSDNIGLQD